MHCTWSRSVISWSSFECKIELGSSIEKGFEVLTSALRTLSLRLAPVYGGLSHIKSDCVAILILLSLFMFVWVLVWFESYRFFLQIWHPIACWKSLASCDGLSWIRETSDVWWGFVVNKYTNIETYTHAASDTGITHAQIPHIHTRARINEHKFKHNTNTHTRVHSTSVHFQTWHTPHRSRTASRCVCSRNPWKGAQSASNFRAPFAIRH